MTNRIVMRKFDPSRPVYASKKFQANGRTYTPGDEFAWRGMAVDKRRVRLMYDAGMLTHMDERPRQELVRERNMGEKREVVKSVVEELTPSEIDPSDGIESLIEEQSPQIEYPIHLGGPWYELSSGEKVKGKEAAEDAEMAL